MYASANTTVRAFFPYEAPGAETRIACQWPGLRDQLLSQWKKLTQKDLESAGPDKQKIAALVERRYGIPATLVENYLSNLERTLPAL